MAARALWKGYLRLSLVSIPVEVFNAVESKAEISFRQIHKPSGRRINYEKVVQGIGKVESDDIVKGYEIDRDTYVILEPDEIDAVKLESKKTIDLVKFVDAAEIDHRFFERPYFLAPADEHGGEGYVVIRDALRKTGKAGLAQITMHGREHLAAVVPLKDGLMLELLRYAEELREPDEFFESVPADKPAKDMVELAVELIGRKSGRFAPGEFKNHYTSALRELIEKKRKGQKVIATGEEPVRSGKVIDLMDALKKSIGNDKGRGKASAARPKKQA